MAKKRATHLRGGFPLRHGALAEIDAALIGTSSMVYSGFSLREIVAIRIGFGVAPNPDGAAVAAEPAIFESHLVTSAHVGKTFYETATTDPNFPLVVSRLTDGVDDLAFLRTFDIPDIDGSGTLGGAYESVFFKGSKLANGIDFKGHQITRIGMRIDALTFSTAFDTDLQRTSYWYELTLTILIERKHPVSTSRSEA